MSSNKRNSNGVTLMLLEYACARSAAFFVIFLDCQSISASLAVITGQFKCASYKPFELSLVCASKVNVRLVSCISRSRSCRRMHATAATSHRGFKNTNWDNSIDVQSPTLENK